MRWAVDARFPTGFCVLPGSACAARDHFRTRLRSMCVCSDVWVLVRNCRARARTIMRHAGNGARRGRVSFRVRYHVTTRAAARRAQAPYATAAREGARRNVGPRHSMVSIDSNAVVVKPPHTPRRISPPLPPSGPAAAGPVSPRAASTDSAGPLDDTTTKRAYTPDTTPAPIRCS